MQNPPLKFIVRHRKQVMELIKIQQTDINGSEVNSVNARELHKALEVKKAFTTWISKALSNAKAEIDVDYVMLKSSLEGSGYRYDYIITTDMSKHIAMMSKVPKAKEVRDYFIEVEKQAQKVLTTSEQIALIAQGHQEVDKRLTVLEQTKKLEYWQEKSLQDAKNIKVYEIAKDDKLLAAKLHRKIWGVFKKKFHLPRYNELPAVKYQEGLDFLDNLLLSDLL